MQNRFVICLILLFAICASVCNAGVAKKKFSVSEPASVTATVQDSSTQNSASAIVVAPPVEPSLWQRFTKAQADLRLAISQKITAMKNGDWSVIWPFLLICLGYGLLHALGPGHGKSIVVGYFLARRGGWRQGLGMGAMITTTHTLSAVVLLFALYAVLKAAVFPTFEIGRVGIEKTCYALVMLTGILLVFIAIREAVSSRKNHGEMKLSSRASWKEIAAVAAVTGIVPCPAVALIVLFCLLNDMILLSLVSALVICIGMTITNMSFGFIAIALRKGIDKGAARSGNKASVIYVIATVLGGLVVFTTGLMLLMNMYASPV